MNLDEIQQIFFQECDEGLAMMEASFAQLRSGDYDAETINTVFRAVHSIKGGAGAFGHDRLQGYAHHYETVLDQVRNAQLALTPDLLNLIIGAFDKLSDHVGAARGETDTPADAVMLERLAAASEGRAIATDDDGATAPAASTAPADDFDSLFDLLDAEDTGPAPWRVSLRPGPRAFDHGGEPVLLLRELAMLGADVIAVDTDALPALADLDTDRSYLAWTVRVPGTVDEADIRGIFDFMDDAFELDVVRDHGIVATAPVEASADAGDDTDIFDAMLADLGPAPVVEAPAPAPAAAPKPAPVSPAAAVVPIQTVLPTEAATPRAATLPASQTIRVDLDKLDRLVNLVGELVITQAMLAQRLSEHSLTGISELTDLDHLTRELQDSTMAIRAQPMKTVFSRVPRIIRELELETGKRVRLDVEGEMTEVDKTVVERIGEPLTHLIRNAVDHGIETPAERVAAGKPEEGVVKLSAAHQSGRIVITISDDGRGIDRKRVREKAIEKRIIAPDATLSDEEIDNLIFAPGFSTAATVSNISGRGVGMDVVRKNVQALGGRIGIVSNLGKGSSFSLSLPLTLAVLDGMIVTVGEQTFVIPLSHIVESLRPQSGEVRAMGPDASLLNVRGDYVPVHRVGEQLGIAQSTVDPEKAVLIVVESDAGQAVLMVDTIQDQRQVVVKSLEANYEAIHGLAGATILGDGRVALILDVDALISRWRRDGRGGGAPQRLAA
ncbi:chemotaxis protein CheA [Sphingomonas sp. Leaf17]|uniref:chemotaxis protein CheA n=1 Tax=Sphingomonas sp. Leaf17 TaxID=1735683 RepID=UPI0006F7C485|nr:chemotaxis protein CheA [Sphingomonas sp. Leaf17]KQM67413.1 chemotaxis protein CheA [Sphingomonas sp. Leaf17]